MGALAGSCAAIAVRYFSATFSRHARSQDWAAPGVGSAIAEMPSNATMPQAETKSWLFIGDPFLIGARQRECPFENRIAEVNVVVKGVGQRHVGIEARNVRWKERHDPEATRLTPAGAGIVMQPRRIPNAQFRVWQFHRTAFGPRADAIACRFTDDRHLVT